MCNLTQVSLLCNEMGIRKFGPQSISTIRHPFSSTITFLFALSLRPSKAGRGDAATNE
jgi:hypothetical protein